MAQHKWHKEIKAWLDGVNVEFRQGMVWEWESLADKYNLGIFDGQGYEFRIKPQPKEPQYLYVYRNPDGRLGLGDTLNNANCIGKIKLEVDDNGTI